MINSASAPAPRNLSATSLLMLIGGGGTGRCHIGRFCEEKRSSVEYADKRRTYSVRATAFLIPLSQEGSATEPKGNGGGMANSTVVL